MDESSKCIITLFVAVANISNLRSSLTFSSRYG